jgi:hypothetical protein
VDDCARDNRPVDDCDIVYRTALGATAPLMTGTVQDYAWDDGTSR